MAFADMGPNKPETGNSADIAGFLVEARDGSIGRVDHSGAGWIVIVTSPVMLGKKVTLPAATIERIDYGQECVYVSRYRDEIEN